MLFVDQLWIIELDEGSEGLCPVPVTDFERLDAAVKALTEQLSRLLENVPGQTADKQMIPMGHYEAWN